MDGDEQVERRSNITDGLCRSTLLDIQDVLSENHKYIKELKCAYEVANSRSIGNFKIVISEAARPLGTHERTYNAPTLNEVAILRPNNPVGHRDIVLHTRTEQLQRISEFHYRPMTVCSILCFSHVEVIAGISY